MTKYINVSKVKQFLDSNKYKDYSQKEISDNCNLRQRIVKGVLEVLVKDNTLEIVGIGNKVFGGEPKPYGRYRYRIKRGGGL